MPKDKVSDWSSAPANNTDVGGIDIAEGCAPSGINNAIREVMAQIKDMQSGLDSDNFTVGGNLSVTGTSTLTGNVTTSGTLAVTGLTTATGGVAGDIFASNGTSKVLENGTDGTNATFTGDIFANNGTSKILENGSDGTNATFTGTSSKATNIVGGNNTTLLGSIPYQSNTDTTTLLSPNTTTTKRYLSQTGTGTNGAAPVWDTITDAFTLLGTITTTSGTSASLSSLTLTGYRQIQFVFNGVSSTATVSSVMLRILDQNGTSSLDVGEFSNSANNTMSGIMTLDLFTGVFVSSIFRANAGTPSSGSGQIFSGITTFSTSTTSFTFNISSTAFDAGSIRVYGIK